MRALLPAPQPATAGQRVWLQPPADGSSVGLFIAVVLLVLPARSVAVGPYGWFAHACTAFGFRLVL